MVVAPNWNVINIVCQAHVDSGCWAAANAGVRPTPTTTERVHFASVDVKQAFLSRVVAAEVAAAPDHEIFPTPPPLASEFDMQDDPHRNLYTSASRAAKENKVWSALPFAAFERNCCQHVVNSILYCNMLSSPQVTVRVACEERSSDTRTTRSIAMPPPPPHHTHTRKHYHDAHCLPIRCHCHQGASSLLVCNTRYPCASEKFCLTGCST
jgi:hypothetical protein